MAIEFPVSREPGKRSTLEFPRHLGNSRAVLRTKYGVVAIYLPEFVRLRLTLILRNSAREQGVVLLRK